MSRTLLALLAALACAGAAEAAPSAPAERQGVPPVADLDAAARAAGNRPREAYRLGRVLFATVWPAQIMKVRVDGAGEHEIAGLVISGVKFHRALDAAAFADQVIRLVQETFAASPVEEVDVWTTIPLPIDKIAAKRLVVSGDYAHPTARTVFSLTVRRSEALTFVERVRRGVDVFWDPAWKASLTGKGAQSGSANPDGSAPPGIS
jgi:hypothetical protein